jgi:enamine deaminase RidA (YjgF/YER057c/UK114 family)
MASIGIAGPTVPLPRVNDVTVAHNGAGPTTGPADIPISQRNETHEHPPSPQNVAEPFGPYSHAVEVPEGSRLLYISGEVGVLTHGTVPDGIEAQAEACWRNIIAILADAGMESGIW